ncbi:MAG: response regulator [Chloroflexota bacterium]|nr:response regulator [Chloroflexota bacterium]
MTTNILYIEDDATQIELVRMFVAKEGFAILGAQDGMTGIQIALAQQPALILMDINLPSMNGVDVAYHMRNTPEIAHIPIIALTSTMKGSVIEPYVGTLFEAYVQKPITRADLLAYLQHFVGQPE